MRARANGKRTAPALHWHWRLLTSVWNEDWQMEFYTRLDLRRMFQISDRTLRRWVQQGTLPPPAFQHRWTREQIDSAICGHLQTRTKKSLEHGDQR